MNDLMGLTNSRDRVLVAGIDGTGTVLLVDVDSWTSATAAPCDVSAVGLGEETTDGLWYVYMGCDDGTMERWVWNGATLKASTDSDGNAITQTVADGDPVANVFVTASGDVFATTVGTNEAVLMHSMREDLGNLDGVAGYPVGFANTGLFDATFNLHVDPEPTLERVTISHQGARHSVLTLGTAAPTFAGQQTISTTPVDLAASIDGLAYVADDADRISRLTGQSSSSGVLVLLQDVTSPNALTYYDDGSAEGPHILVQDDVQFSAFPFDANGNLSSTATRVFPIDAVGLDMMLGPDGYVFMGTEQSGLMVLTDRPWVSNLTLGDSSGVTGDEVTFSFTLDEATTWSLHVGGNRSGNGTELASGTATEPGIISSAFTVTDEFEAGESFLYLVAGPSGRQGHARTTFDVDNPPGKVTLRQGDVQFDDSQLTVVFDGLEESDIREYRVYWSDKRFSASDWQAINFPDQGTPGGPTSDAEGSPPSPTVVEATGEGGTVAVTLTPLTNGTTYYMAVRAVDESGMEGPMSSVVNEKPRATCLASECIGEPGGVSCSTGGPGGSGGLALLAIAGGALLRRRRSLATLAVVAGLGLGTTAQAQTTPDPDGPRAGIRAVLGEDATPVRGKFSVTFGSHRMQDETLQAAYGDGITTFRIETGPVFWQIAELDVGIGWSGKKGAKLSEGDLSASGTPTRIDWMPVWGGAKVRLQVLDEQPVVPYAGVGGEWVFWRERQLDPETDTYNDGKQVTGQKGGWYWKAGAGILLDLFDPRRASRNEAANGINDTWLILEFREDRVGGTPTHPLSFSGWSFSGGLQMDF